MLSTLVTETTATGGFPVTGLITIVVAAAIFYPVQKKVREAASRSRRERWAEEDRVAEQQRQAREPDGQADAGDGDLAP